jgi:hypothetical protein
MDPDVPEGEEKRLPERTCSEMPEDRLQRRYKIIMIVGIIVAIICQILKILLSTPSWAYGTLDTFTLLGALSSILSVFTSSTRWEMRQEFGQLRGEIRQMRGELRQMREELLRALGEIRDLLKK